MLFFSVFLNISLSLQMCITGSYWNAFLIFLEFAILRTIFFVTRSMVSFSSKFKYYYNNRFFKRSLDLFFCKIIRYGFSFFTFTFPVINLVFFLLYAWYRQLQAKWPSTRFTKLFLERTEPISYQFWLDYHEFKLLIKVGLFGKPVSIKNKSFSSLFKFPQALLLYVLFVLYMFLQKLFRSFELVMLDICI